MAGIFYQGNEGNTTIKQIFKQNSAVGFRAFLFILLALLLMVLDQSNNAFHRVRSSLSIVVAPIQYVVSVPIDIASWIITDISSQQKLVQDNAHLRAQLIFLKAELQKQYGIKSDNKQLRALLQSSARAEGKVLAAQLLAVSPDPFVKQVVINKGLMQKVFIGQPVFDAYGVMGQVIDVGPLTSRLMLLTDSQSSIPVQINRNGIRAIAVGDSALDLLKLQHVTVTSDVQQGDMVVTSGLGGHYPYGYPVGTVIAIKHYPGEQFADITVSPAAHLDRSHLVLLIWPAKSQHKGQK